MRSSLAPLELCTVYIALLKLSHKKGSHASNGGPGLAALKLSRGSQPQEGTSDTRLAARACRQPLTSTILANGGTLPCDVQWSANWIAKMASVDDIFKVRSLVFDFDIINRHSNKLTELGHLLQAQAESHPRSKYVRLESHTG